MRKIIICSYFLFFNLANAANNKLLQNFENQYNLGYEFSQGTLINGPGQTATYNLQLVDLEIEHLFNNSIWVDAHISTVTNYNQPNLGYFNGGNGSNVAFGQDPFMTSLNFKVGYGFQLVNNTLQIIPYGMFGRNANYATSTVLANNSLNLTKDYFFTGGLGARLYYHINEAFTVYADQLYSYNWDQSGAIKSIQSAPSFYGKSYAATNYNFTSTIGAKINVYRDLQLGVNGFWNNYQPQSNVSGLMYIPKNSFGTMVSIGLTY